MKVLAFVAAMVTVTVSYPVLKTWTFDELTNAIETTINNHEDPDSIKDIIDARMLFMSLLYSGNTEDEYYAIFVNLISPTGSIFWTKCQLKNESENPDLEPSLKPFLERNYQFMLHGDGDEFSEVVVPAMDISTWTSADISDALADPETNEALIPHLEKAKEEFKEAIQKGNAKDHATLYSPVGLVKTKGVKPKFASKKYPEI